MNPRIPDAAFQAVADHGDTLLDVTMGTATSPQEAAEAGHVYARSLGLDGENDQRAKQLARSSLAHLSQARPSHIVTENEGLRRRGGDQARPRARARDVVGAADARAGIASTAFRCCSASSSGSRTGRATTGSTRSSTPTLVSGSIPFFIFMEKDKRWAAGTTR